MSLCKVFLTSSHSSRRKKQQIKTQQHPCCSFILDLSVNQHAMMWIKEQQGCTDLMSPSFVGSCVAARLLSCSNDSSANKLQGSHLCVTYCNASAFQNRNLALVNFQTVKEYSVKTSFEPWTRFWMIRFLSRLENIEELHCIKVWKKFEWLDAVNMIVKLFVPIQ